MLRVLFSPRCQTTCNPKRNDLQSDPNANTRRDVAEKSQASADPAHERAPMLRGSILCGQRQIAPLCCKMLSACVLLLSVLSLLRHVHVPPGLPEPDLTLGGGNEGGGGCDGLGGGDLGGGHVGDGDVGGGEGGGLRGGGEGPDVTATLAVATEAVALQPSCRRRDCGCRLHRTCTWSSTAALHRRTTSSCPMRPCSRSWATLVRRRSPPTRPSFCGRRSASSKCWCSLETTSTTRGILMRAPSSRSTTRSPRLPQPQRH